MLQYHGFNQFCQAKMSLYRIRSRLLQTIDLKCKLKPPIQYDAHVEWSKLTWNYFKILRELRSDNKCHFIYY